ncbi:hypothetical protein SDC9_125982 [bioreactor metagenome]|uniref:DUF1015 domain-containing protein n=1 Tax=bioreactor metagenome TaxID=1076179 RepID=A0A645CPY1_9ZZZZ
MALIRPFKALRYNEKKISSIKNVCCPPYDIISQEKQDELYRADEHNIIRLELAREEDRYLASKEYLQKFLQDDILIQDNQESLYVYEEEFSAGGSRKKIKGIICLVRLEEFSKGIILPHEETLSKAKTDRFNLMKATGCNFSSIYSLYLDEENVAFPMIDGLSRNQAEAEFTDEDGITQRIWAITDTKAIERLTEVFKDKKLFIADGHHRYETALNYREYLKEKGIIKDESHHGNFVMMMLVNMENDGLVVFPTHRLIRDLKGFHLDSVLEKAKEDFIIEKCFGIDNMEAVLAKKIDQKAFCLYYGDDAYYIFSLRDENILLKYFEQNSPAYRGLDVNVLHTLVLDKILGIDKENMAKQINLTYTRDILEAINGVKEKKYQCSFILNPTKISEIKDVSLANEKMPQKSTYFYPKLITGLVMNKIL